MPKPKKNESEKDFVSRCVPMVIDEGTAKDGSQGAAICHSIYKQEKEKMSGHKEKEKYSESMLEDAYDLDIFRPDLRSKIKEHAKSHSVMHMAIIMRELRNGKTWGQARRIAMDRVGK